MGTRMGMGNWGGNCERRHDKQQRTDCRVAQMWYDRARIVHSEIGWSVRWVELWWKPRGVSQCVAYSEARISVSCRTRRQRTAVNGDATLKLPLASRL